MFGAISHSLHFFIELESTTGFPKYGMFCTVVSSEIHISQIGTLDEIGVHWFDWWHWH